MFKSLFSAFGVSTFALCFGVMVSYSKPAAAQQLKVDTPSLLSKPAQLTAQQTQIVNGMTSAQIQAYASKLQPTFTKLKNDIAAYRQSTTVPSWQDFIRGTATTSLEQQVSAVATPTYNFTNSSGGALTLKANAVVGPGNGWPKPCPVYGCGGCPPTICGGGGSFDPDNDQDGLPDGFEGNVADNFTPFYGSSAGEQDQFATFGDYVPMTLTSLVGTVPPFSYYRVQPLGLATDPNGNQVFALRIDYLTLWNADGGLVGGGAACLYSYVGLDDVVNQVSGHDLDAERSGIRAIAFQNISRSR